MQSGKQGTVATLDAGHLGSVQELARSGQQSLKEVATVPHSQQNLQ